jgi:N-methylhydantoinase B
MEDQDGMDGVHTNMTNTRNAPAEVIEIAYPLRVDRYGLVAESEGPGRARGGMGMTREITVLGHEAAITLGTERRALRPWGLGGGSPGGSSDCRIETPSGEEKALPTKVTMRVEPGTRIVLKTAGGGGYGPPGERAPEKVLRDVEQGLISVRRAREEYGVVIREHPLRIDEDETAQLRQRRRESSPQAV